MRHQHRRALEVYRQNQQHPLSHPVPGSGTQYPSQNYDCEVIDIASSQRQRAAGAYMAPQVIFVQEPPHLQPQPAWGPQNESDPSLEVFIAAFFGCAAFFVLYTLITLLASVG